MATNDLSSNVKSRTSGHCKNISLEVNCGPDDLGLQRGAFGIPKEVFKTLVQGLGFKVI